MEPLFWHLKSTEKQFKYLLNTFTKVPKGNYIEKVKKCISFIFLSVFQTG